MEQFPHLVFKQKFIGKPHFPRFPDRDDPISIANRENRAQHRDALIGKTNAVKAQWVATLTEREQKNLAALDPNVIPILLQVKPGMLSQPQLSLFDSFGIEIVSDVSGENDGLIIGASFDNFQSLNNKINDFVTQQRGSATIADFWNIIDGNRELWKPQHILSEQLLAKWNAVADDDTYKVEIGIAFDMPLRKEPSNKNGKRYEKYIKYCEYRDVCLMNRQTHLENFIGNYGEVTSEYVELEDCFCCEVTISGKGLRDLVVNYQYVFEVSEVDIINGVVGDDGSGDEFELEVLPPTADSPVIGVIDSGIMENNKYIEHAIDDIFSMTYVSGSTSTADYVKGGGHGTKVAGAILYPSGVSGVASPYTLPCYIRNIRVLNEDNDLLHRFPAELMQQIVRDNPECDIYNMSLNATSPYRIKHMSTWGAVIDTLSHEQDLLFIISAGNIDKGDIRYYLNNGKVYPDYLSEANCRVANPGQSLFALTVGSLNHSQFDDGNSKSLGTENEISAFSRVGTGIWNTIKPDVVEYGGGVCSSTDGNNFISWNEHTLPELVRSTINGGAAFGKDFPGTSFSTPKVTHIAAQLKKLYPEEGSNLIRALIVQGARLPNEHFENPTSQSIRHFGNGLPSLQRVTTNTERRITYYNTGTLAVEKGDIYSLNIPPYLRDGANEFDVLLEVTLAYTGQVRRTRQKLRSYLSTWLDWTSSIVGESYSEFVDRTIYNKKGSATNQEGVIQWKLRERGHWGDVKDINRTNNTVQKDYAIFKAYELPSELSFAIRAHKGWDKTNAEIPYAFTVSIEVLGSDLPIYDQIRIANLVEIEV